MENRLDAHLTRKILHLSVRVADDNLEKTHQTLETCKTNPFSAASTYLHVVLACEQWSILA
jgi:hypothetical protein